MPYFTIILVQKTKTASIADLIAEYQKRLRPYAKVNFITIKEPPYSAKPLPTIIKSLEAQKILAALPKNAYLIALTPDGRSFTSPQFASLISNLSIQGNSHLCFIIGGPFGLDETVLKRAQLQLSLSPLTFTHEMTRIILLEQLYRAATIINGKTYHY